MLKVPENAVGIDHSYWLSRWKYKFLAKNKNIYGAAHLSGWALINAFGLSRLMLNGLLDEVVLTTGKVWGSKFPSVSELTEEYLLKFGVRGERIHVFPYAFDTVSETLVANRFLDTFRPEKRRVEICGSRAHKRTIEYLGREFHHNNVGVFSIEDYFVESRDPTGLFLLKNMPKKINLMHSAYEIAKLLVCKSGIMSAESMMQEAAATRSSEPRYNVYIPKVKFLGKDIRLPRTDVYEI